MTRVSNSNEPGVRYLTGSAPFNTTACFHVNNRADIVKSPIHDKRTWRPPMAYFANGYDHRVHFGSGSYNDGRKWSGVLSPGICTDPVPNLPAIPTGLRSRAEVGALLKLKDQQINFGQAFGERAQTARLFGEQLSRVAKAYMALRHGNIGAACDQLGMRMNNSQYKQWKHWIKDAYKTPAQLWLELQYGWKPLLTDIHGACYELDRLEIELGDKAYITTVKKRAMTYRKYDPGTNNISWPNMRTMRRERQAVMVRLDYTPKDVELQRLSSLGLTNPAIIAWELMPWSFVIDWAIPIGNWINALDAASGYNFLAGCRTELTRIRDRRTHSGPVPNIGVTSSNFVGSTHRWDMQRTLYASSPIPALPGFKNPVSDAHVKNALALLITAFRGGGSKGQGF